MISSQCLRSGRSFSNFLGFTIDGDPMGSAGNKGSLYLRPILGIESKQADARRRARTKKSSQCSIGRNQWRRIQNALHSLESVFSYFYRSFRTKNTFNYTLTSAKWHKFLLEESQKSEAHMKWLLFTISLSPLGKS